MLNVTVELDRRMVPLADTPVPPLLDIALLSTFIVLPASAWTPNELLPEKTECWATTLLPVAPVRPLQIVGRTHVIEHDVVGACRRQTDAGSAIVTDDRVADEELGASGGAQIGDALLGELRDHAILDRDRRPRSGS